MPAAVLFPVFDHSALEERYASRQSQMLLRREHPAFRFYERDAGAASLDGIVEANILVITDPLLLPAPGLGALLEEAIGSAFAAVPASNEGGHPGQRAALAPYMTLREFEGVAAASREEGRVTVTWERHDPGAFLCRTEALRSIGGPLTRALEGREVVIERRAVVHRWASLRGQTRDDLLDRIARDARSVLEFGCGEATLGAALKRRQTCRVVGIELDAAAAEVARSRIDAVVRGDVRQVLAEIDETFDCIVGGDIVEHLDEPWSFLRDLRRLSAPGGRLLLSIPNVANASIVADLLQGRFDYVYMGLTCVGHLRFFTRRSLEELLAMSGWEVESIEPQTLTVTPDSEQLLGALRKAGIDFDEGAVAPTGFYVTARNPS